MNFALTALPEELQGKLALAYRADRLMGYDHKETLGVLVTMFLSKYPGYGRSAVERFVNGLKGKPLF